MGSVEAAPGITAQPKQLPHLQGMVELLDAIDSIAINEEGAQGPANNWNGSGGAVATKGTKSVSPRDQAIANLPLPKIMVRQLESHIVAEIKDLRHQVRSVTKLRQPGGAYKLNELYARIHRLQSLLHEIFASSYEVLRRLFIKVFIDKQPLL